MDKYQVPDWVTTTQKIRYGESIPHTFTEYEKLVIDSDGKYDGSGNRYVVVWTIMGMPLSAKINHLDGRRYVQNNPNGKYQYIQGCCEALEMD